MENTPKIESGEKPIESFEDLMPQLGVEYREFARAHLEGVKNELEQIVKKNLMTEKRASEVFAQTYSEQEAQDSEMRIRNLLNNFFFWWPGGYYRQLVEERENNINNHEDLVEAKQLMKDLDDAIREGGYEPIAESVAKRTANKNVGLKALADVYLRMRDRGYERTRLTK